MKNRPQTPLFATVNITTACNLNCRYCFLQPRSNEYMLRTDFERIVEELAGLPVFFINISGGEPFMHPQVADFLQIAHGKIQHVMVLTNGTKITREHFGTISDILRSKGAFTLQVSLDAVDTAINELTRGDAGVVLGNIRALCGIGAHVIVAMVVTRCNAERIIESIELLSEHTRYFHLMTVQDVRGVGGIEKRYCLPHKDEGSLWQRVQELAARKNLFVNTPIQYEGYRGCASGAPCMAAFSHIVIDPSLKVRPCDRLTDVVLGDLRKSTVSAVWDSPTARGVTQCRVPYCRLQI